VLLGFGGAEHEVGGTLGQTTTNTRERAMSKQERGSDENILYNACCITQCSSINTFALKVFEDPGQLDVGLAVARRQQQADCRYIRIGISEEWAFRQKETGLAPCFFLIPFFRWRCRWVVAGKAGVGGSWLNDQGLSADGGRETA